VFNSGSMIPHDWPFNIVVASGASTTIVNTGYMRGNLQLSSFNDTVNNSGEWVMRRSSDFGTGTDAVNNSGIVSLYSTGRDTVFLRGLENFNNTGGLVTMVDGGIRDRIVLSGNFNGTGDSTLAVDAFLGGPGSRADVLEVRGDVGGTTAVVVNDTNFGRVAKYNPRGIPVVEVGGFTDDGDFFLAGGAIPKGFFSYGLFLRDGSCDRAFASASACWVLASTPNQAAHELPRLVTAANDIWHQSAGVWLDRTADLRTQFFGVPGVALAADLKVVPKAPRGQPEPVYGGGPGFWVKGFGDWSSSDGNATFTAFGTSLSYDVSYDQATYGVQAGVDWSSNRVGYSTIIVGLMGGYVGSKVEFNGSSTSATFAGGTVGGYATYLNRGFFVDTLLMANFLNLDYRSQFAAFNEASVMSFGGHIDAGYRFNMAPGWFVEPLGTLEFVHSDFDDLSVPGASVSLGGSTWRGRLGARFGTAWMSGGYRLEPSFTASVWHKFSGEQSASLTSGGYTVTVFDPNQHDTYGEVGAAINIFEVAGSWSGFLKGDFRFADGYHGGSAKGGVRFHW
jgi:outer membrane autotransporter protein